MWAGACTGKLLGLRGELDWSRLDYLRSARDGKRDAWKRQPTNHIRTHTHGLKPLNHFAVVPDSLFPLRFNTGIIAGGAAGMGSIKIDKMTKTNFHAWRQRIKMVPAVRDLDDMLD